ncbi:hypothetical protein Pint_29152 [Pistacia integerrima]|uniref:Uncharacterized protein n=1 Tax=Pistacia integerrima TaxID=434235 RepID=A0ACC0WY24_9ROSI|nr:hypothetical protein Pint_29152 [Pistacia integerrima]
MTLHFCFLSPIQAYRDSSLLSNFFNLTVYQVLLELSRTRNRIPLPKVIASPGIALPPEQDTLIGPNYQLLIPKNSAQPMEETEEDEETAEPSTSQQQKTDLPQQRIDLPQQTPQAQRVAFQLKRPKRETF